MDTHAKSITQLMGELQASEGGLSGNNAEKLLKKYGENKLPDSSTQITRFNIFLDQWKSPLIIILVVAAIASFLLHELLDSLVIVITIAVNVIIGFVQEDKADRALEKLHKIVTYKAIVLRDGQKIQIESNEIVPGDVLYIKAGEMNRCLQESRNL